MGHGSQEACLGIGLPVRFIPLRFRPDELRLFRSQLLFHEAVVVLQDGVVFPDSLRNVNVGEDDRVNSHSDPGKQGKVSDLNDHGPDDVDKDAGRKEAHGKEFLYVPHIPCPTECRKETPGDKEQNDGDHQVGERSHLKEIPGAGKLQDGLNQDIRERKNNKRCKPLPVFLFETVLIIEKEETGKGCVQNENNHGIEDGIPVKDGKRLRLYGGLHALHKTENCEERHTVAASRCPCPNRRNQEKENAHGKDKDDKGKRRNSPAKIRENHVVPVPV